MDADRTRGFDEQRILIAEQLSRIGVLMSETSRQKRLFAERLALTEQLGLAERVHRMADRAGLLAERMGRSAERMILFAQRNAVRISPIDTLEFTPIPQQTSD